MTRGVPPHRSLHIGNGNGPSLGGDDDSASPVDPYQGCDPFAATYGTGAEATGWRDPGVLFGGTTFVVSPAAFSAAPAAEHQALNTGATAAATINDSPATFVLSSTVVDGSFSFSVSIQRPDGKAIDTSETTWFLIHGWNSSPATFNGLVSAIQSQRPSDQILTLDWSAGANTGLLDPSSAEERIPLVANWAAPALVSFGFSGSTLNLIGHSFGAYIAGETAEQIPGGVGTIVTLDPAIDISGGYNPEGPGGVNFAQYSMLSWAFHDSDPSNIFSEDGLGSAVTPITSDEAFDVASSSHTQIPTLFTYFVNHPADAVGQYFSLQRLLDHTPDLWNFNGYNASGSLAVGGGYEGVITATSGGVVPLKIVGADDYPATVSTTGAVTPDGSATTGSIDWNGDRDWFQTQVTQGTTYTIDLVSGSSPQAAPFLANPEVYLYDSSGTLVAANDDFGGVNSHLTFLATYSGTYYIGASAHGDKATGAYKVSIAATVPTAPEIVAVGNGADIVDGDTTPSALDFTDFGSVTQGGGAIQHSFTVTNLGTATLMLGVISLPTGFSLVEGLSSSLAPSGSDSFTVQLDTASTGPKSGQISFATNDGDENPFDFSIAGVVIAPLFSEIEIQGNGLSIADGDTTPSAADFTDFGSVTQGGGAIQHSFTVTNAGTATLTLGTLSLPTGFSLVEGLSSSLAPSGSDTFTVQLDTTSTGPKSGQISFATNDSDENPFNFSIVGAVTAPLIPEIAVVGNSVSITDGDTTPSAADFTDFGSVTQGGGAIQHSFTVANSGTATLTLGALSLPTGFSLVEGLSSSLAPGNSDTFTVQLDTASTGPKSGQISFATNDGNENPFNFFIAGSVTAPLVPEIAVLGNGVSITDGDTTPNASDLTDFGSVTQGGGPVQHSFTVTNSGTATLTLGAISLPTGFSLVEGLSSSLASGSDSFTVQLDTTSTGPKSGQISFSTNDSDENPFNFSIAGSVTAPLVPEIAVTANGVDIADGDTTPNASDLTDFGSVTQGGGPVQHSFTVMNSGTATLTLGAVSLPTGFSLVEGLSSSLASGGSDTFTVQLDTTSTGPKSGQISFATNDSDENPFNFSIAGAVNAPPVPPVPHLDLYIAQADTPLTVSSESGVLSNDDELNGSVLSAALSQPPLHGALTLQPDGSFTYTPQAGFVGTDSFSYVPTDALSTGVAQVVSIVVGDIDALATPEQVLSELYVGYYNRAPDAGGLNFWIDNFTTPPEESPGGVNPFYQNLPKAADSFADPGQAETVALYPFLADPGSADYDDVVGFVQDAYGNLFNRATDPGGEAFWSTAIAKSLGIAVPTFDDPVIDGTSPVSASRALIAFIFGALGADAQTVANKVIAGLYYTHTLEDNGVAATAESAHDAFSGVTSDLATVLVSEAATNAFVHSALSAALLAVPLAGIIDNPHQSLVAGW